MSRKQHKISAPAKMTNRHKPTHERSGCRHFLRVDVDTATVAHGDGWHVHLFPLDEPERLPSYIDFKLAMMTNKEREAGIEAVTEGLAYLKSIGL